MARITSATGVTVSISLTELQHGISELGDEPTDDNERADIDNLDTMDAYEDSLDSGGIDALEEAFIRGLRYAQEEAFAKI